MAERRQSFQKQVNRIVDVRDHRKLARGGGDQGRSAGQDRNEYQEQAGASQETCYRAEMRGFAFSDPETNSLQ